MTKKNIYWLIMVLLCFAFTTNFVGYHNKVPVGCDEYGYLYLSEAMSTGKTFEEHTSRPYLPSLLSHLDSNKVNRAEYLYMVAPLAYYLRDDSSKIINMYNPGTSWLLHFIALGYRKYAFPLLVILLFLPLLYWVAKGNKEFTCTDIALAVFVLLMFLPFSVLRTEFTRVNSLAPTFGLLALAGYLLKRKPELSIFLIVLSANMRLGNVFLIWPIFLFILYQLYKDQSPLAAIFKRVLSIGIGCAIAISPYIFYVTMLLGSPLKSTYSAIDTSFASNAVNLSFYTQFSSQWFWMHLVGLAMIFWLYKKGKLKAEYLLLLLVMVVFNYLFYSFKLISMNYYTYATAFILIGFILHELSLVKMKESWQASVKWSVLGIYVIMFVAGLIEFSKFEKPTFTQSAKTYQELKPYNIVWCDLLSGTTEYANGNSGFMFNRGTAHARKLAYQFFYKNHYSQVFLLNDLPINKDLLIAELVQTEIPYQLKQSSLGPLIVVENGF